MKITSKRVGFVSVQEAHTVACDGYHAPIIGTDYEKVVGHRTNTYFCSVAEESGQVMQINDKGILVKYENGKTKGYPLGVMLGKAEGSIYPHPLVAHPNLKVGAKVKKGQVLTYNKRFFTEDPHNPDSVLLMKNLYAWTVFAQAAVTDEDSSQISPELSARLRMQSCKQKSRILDFEEGILEIVKPGQVVKPSDPLYVIQDAITTSADFSEDSLSTLRRQSSQSPKAKVHGVVDRVEVFYHGDKSDMHPSLKKIADASDAEIMARQKAIGGPLYNGQTNSEHRVGGVPLMLNKLELRITIIRHEKSGRGDKAVFGPQLKSTHSGVLPGPIVTEQGIKVDAFFSYASPANRVVLSTMIQGGIASLTSTIAKRALALK